MSKVRDVKQLTPTWPITPEARERDPKRRAPSTTRKRRRRKKDDVSGDPSKHIDEYV
ncbi:MAG: hypothetical protein OES09_05830 [Gammaproteobacteria bacterium]|nr:hypothetical protein [Gammaproteobacteria bacterium]